MFEHDALRDIEQRGEDLAAIEPARTRREFNDPGYVVAGQRTQSLSARWRDGPHAADGALMLIHCAARLKAESFVKRLAGGRGMQECDALAKRFERQLHQPATDTAPLLQGRHDHEAQR